MIKYKEKFYISIAKNNAAIPDDFNSKLIYVSFIKFFILNIFLKFLFSNVQQSKLYLLISMNFFIIVQISFIIYNQGGNINIYLTMESLIILVFMIVKYRIK